MNQAFRPPNVDEEKLDWLQLFRSPNIGPITFYKLLERYGSARAALDALPGLAKKGGRAQKIAPRGEIEREVAALTKIGGTLAFIGDDLYPPLLAHTADAPPVLQLLGNAQLLRKRSVAIVGARNASSNGRSLARQLAGEIGALGYLVISGLARGIDAAAHEGALARGTVAVLAGGLDVVYPRENGPLYDAIARQGLLISEMPLGCQPQARHFPRRNRIVSGISRGVVVVEASLKSGSMITARLAQEQGRETMAVPGSPLDPRSKGGNQLIRDGATLVESAQDIAEALERPFDPPLRDVSAPLGESTTAPLLPLPLSPPSNEKTERTNKDGARLSVKELLGPSAVSVDDLLRQSHLPPATLNTILLEMELAGQIEWQPGNRVALIA